MIRKTLAFLALAVHRSAEHPRNRDTQERRGDVRPVIHVLIEPTLAVSFAPHQTDGIDVQQQRSLCFLIALPRIKNVGLPKRQFEGLRARRIFVKKIPKIAARNSRGYCEKHFF